MVDPLGLVEERARVQLMPSLSLSLSSAAADSHACSSCQVYLSLSSAAADCHAQQLSISAGRQTRSWLGPLLHRILHRRLPHPPPPLPPPPLPHPPRTICLEPSRLLHRCMCFRLLAIPPHHTVILRRERRYTSEPGICTSSLAQFAFRRSNAGSTHRE
jgi:hypothetical protein